MHPRPLLLRFATLALLLAAPALRAMNAPALPIRDPAAALLRHHGQLRLAAAGNHVGPGTYRVQVAAKLGRPDAVLPDGAWLYHGHSVVGSAARGALLVRFADGRVSSLALLSDSAVRMARSAGSTAALAPLAQN